jgi:methyltransferase (TIGR00027 family)
MREGEASRTAAFVAAARGLAAFLPEGARLVDDPWSALLAGRRVARLRAEGLRHPRLAGRIGPVLARPLLRIALWVQVRSRALDEAVRAFVRDGGRQVLLLGAGYDCRAWRLRDELSGATVFEVDHPATQARKRRVLEAAGADFSQVRMIAWDFEAQPMGGLPAALAAGGHRADAPTITIWEGVTPYLTDGAIDATMETLAKLSAQGSVLAMTYLRRGFLERPGRNGRLGKLILRSLGEPLRFGLEREEVPEWLARRGWTLERLRSERELAEEYMNDRLARRCTDDRSVAIARRER